MISKRTQTDYEECPSTAGIITLRARCDYDMPYVKTHLRTSMLSRQHDHRDSVMRTTKWPMTYCREVMLGNT